MYVQVEHTKDNKNRELSGPVIQIKESGALGFSIVDIRQESVAQRILHESAGNSKRGHQQRAFSEQNVYTGTVQRAINIKGGGEFEKIVERFCAFSKSQGGEAWEMLKWFWHGENNILDVVSVVRPDAKGYTRCLINNKEAHTLTDTEWRELTVDAPAKVVVFINNYGEPLNKNNTGQYYTILHELMVHTYPFYQKMAGYHDGPDNMGAHAEHQHLLNKENMAFYDLYNYMHGKILAGLFYDIEEKFKGINPHEFSNLHEEDIMIQYIETATLKAKNAHAKIKHLIERMKQRIPTRDQNKKEEYEADKKQFESIKENIKEVLDEYRKAYMVHSENYKYPGVEGENLDESSEGNAVLPYFNPDSWYPQTLEKLAKRIGDIEKMDNKLTGYIQQLTYGIASVCK